MTTYKGALHGTPLLDEDPTLEGVLVDWLVGVLKDESSSPTVPRRE